MTYFPSNCGLHRIFYKICHECMAARRSNKSTRETLIIGPNFYSLDRDGEPLRIGLNLPV